MEQGSVLRHEIEGILSYPPHCLNPFGTGQCLTTKANITTATTVQESQSLWNRAVSYDKYRINVGYYETVSIPLEQGSVLRQFLILLEIK